YGDYEVLGVVLEKYLRPSDSILQIGCGNSQLAAQMYDNGFRSIHSIDTDSVVIEEQRARNKQRPELVFLKDDATAMSFGDDSFSAVVDKGTLDALLPPNATPQQLDSVRKVFLEVERVLKVGLGMLSGTGFCYEFTKWETALLDFPCPSSY
ncbi:methyltransferase domain protein, partial [Necator americanus]